MKKIALAASLALAFCASAHAAVLTTTFAGGNGQNGNMFDVVTKANALTVTGLDLNLIAGTYTVEVYKKNGTWVGSENNAGAWTLIDSAALTSNGTPTFFDLADFNLGALSTSGLYITTTSPVGVGLMRYTNGTAVGNVYSQNADLQILEGAGKTYAFADTFTPRIWNGSIQYQIAVNDVPEPASLALFGLGMAGLGLMRRRKQA